MTEHETHSEPSTALQPAVRTRRTGLGMTALFLALAAAAFSGWQWYEARANLQSLQHDLGRRIAEFDARNQDTRSLAGQSRETLREVEARIGQLEARMVESQNQRLALESLYQELSRGRDEWTLAEVEQVMLIASQQLQLAGNVKAALIALETADSRLARMDRPQFTALRRVINADLERLRRVPHVDVAGMSLKLDLAAGRVDALPLVSERMATGQGSDAAVPETGIWRRTWREFFGDLRDLIHIQRLDAGIPLLSPEQAYFLRENLKIRLVGARLALIARDNTGFKADLRTASEWLAKYYLGNDPAVATVQGTLQQLQQSDVDIQLLDISPSLEAMRTLKLVRERSLR